MSSKLNVYDVHAGSFARSMAATLALSRSPSDINLN